MRKCFWPLLIFFQAILIGGCTTPEGIVLKETPLNISETRICVVTVIGEPRMVSENGRELFSNYYDKNGKELVKLNSPRERYTTHVAILGDRRPYDVQVEVLVEERVTFNQYQTIGKDSKKAASIAEKIKNALNQSRDNRNIIDDFRSF